MNIPRPATSENLEAFAKSQGNEDSVFVVLQAKGNNLNPLRFRPGGGTLVMFMIYSKDTGYHEIRIPMTLWNSRIKELVYKFPLPRILMPRIEQHLTAEDKARAAEILKQPMGAGTRSAHDPHPHISIPAPVVRDHDVMVPGEDGKLKPMGMDGEVLPQSLPPRRGLKDPQVPPPHAHRVHEGQHRPQVEPPAVPKEAKPLDLEKELEAELAVAD